MTTGRSELLQYLPEVFRQAASAGDFLDGYLKIFEALLAGRDDVPPAMELRGIEQIIEAIPDLLDPAWTPIDADPPGASPRSAFLDYLAGWLALDYDQSLELAKRREWLRRIVPLYKRRGTRDGLAEYLAMFVRGQVSIEELPGGFIVGSRAHATVGATTFIAGAPAHFFRVRIEYGFAPNAFRIEEWKNLRRGTRAIVDREKPAHTYYALRAHTPGISVGVRATIGRDTLIWQESDPDSSR